jgi:hypothetical protein
MEGKKTFLLYTDMIAVFEELSDEQAGQLIKHIMKYVNDKEPVLTDQLLKVAFAPIKNVLKKDLDVWKKTCERNKENGSKGGRPPKTETVIEEPKKPSGLIGNPKNPNEPDKDKDKDKDISINGKETEITNEIFIELSQSSIWINTVCHNHSVEREDVIEHLRRFYWHCLSNDYFKGNPSNAKRHFNNWIIKGNPIPKSKSNSYAKNPE